MEAIIWIAAFAALAFVPFFSVYCIRRWKQARFNRKWGLPDEPQDEEADSAEIMGKAGVLTGLGDIWRRGI